MSKNPVNENNFYAVLAEKAAEATDLRLLVQNIIQYTLDYMKAAFGSIMVYNKEDDSLKLYASSSHPVFAKGAVKDKKTKISKSDSIAAKVFSSGKPIIFKNNAKSETSKLKLSRADDNGSFMSVPLTISKKTIGVINLNRTTEQESFSTSDLVKLSGINAFIASLIDKETLLEKIETNRKEISALYQMSNLLSESNDFKGRLEEFLSKLSKELGMKRSAIIKTIPQNDKNKNTKSKHQKFEIIASHNLKQNHLESMFESATEPAVEKALMYSSFLSALPGIPSVFYRDILGALGYDEKAK
ncbi:MAG: GAF domain-containing protein, partial [Candidatus Riflebacteria bacterium]|nr:GAF domain-containing protein [Candidatus Riflebacteria bacterium]